MKTPAHMKKTLLAGLIGTSLLAMGATTTVAWAQSSNATLRGHAPPNTQITALNTKTGAVRHAQSNGQGNYTLVGLQPGTYQISAGNGTPKTVTLSVASTATLDLAGGGNAANANATNAAVPSKANATKLNAVTVTGSALHEVKTPEISTTISQHQIQTIPQVSRNFLEFADVVPGMQFRVDSNGNTSLQAGAQSANGVNVYIDGVSQKSYVLGGGIAGQNGTQGNPFPQLAIGQYKVITSNYKAEYGQISSAAVTSQTKSGTNQFHGEVFDRYTSDKFRARTPSENASGKKSRSQEKEFGAALGGPIIKNMAHFFLTYSGKRFVQPIAVVPSADATPGVKYLPPDIAAQLGPAQKPFQENLYFGKLDAEPTDRDRLELSGQIRKEDQRNGIGGTTALSSSINAIHENKRYALKWDHSANLWFNELIVAHQYTSFRPTPLNFGNGAIYTYFIPGKNGATGQDPVIVQTGAASPLAAQNKSQKGWSFKDDLTFNDLEWLGNHVIKMGVVYRKLDLKASDAADENPQFYYNVTDQGLQETPYEAFFTKPVTGLGLTPTVSTNDKQFGVYVQDDWDVTNHLQLNLGVRWDYEKDPAYTGFVTPANVVAAFNSQDPNAPPGQTYAQSMAKGGVDINNYISNGHNRSNYKGEWQPRLGFSYDINDDQAHVIHGGAGRSYDRNLYNYLQLETTKSALPQYRVYFQNPATGACHEGKTPCYAWDPKYLGGLSNLQALLQSTNAGTEVDLLNNDLKAPYSDQFSLGMSNQVGDWQTDVTVTRILYRDGFAFTFGNRYPNGAYFNNPQICNPTANPDHPANAVGCSVPGFGALVLGDNGINSRNTEVLLSAQKPFTKASGWGATFAYTHTHAKQNRDVTQHYSFDYGRIGDYPYIISNAAPENRLVATGSLAGPWGLVFGAKLTLETPTPFNSVSCYDDVRFPSGNNCHVYGKTPDATGRFLVGGKLYGYRDVDFQVTKNFHLGHGITAYARFDLLNAFNFKNYNNFITNNGGAPGSEQVRYNPTGNITYVPRTVKFEVGARF